MGEVRERQSGEFVTHGEFSSFRDDVRDQFKAVKADNDAKHRETMDAIQSVSKATQPKPTNWYAIIASIGALASVVAAFMALWMRPMEEQVARQGENQQQLMAEVKEAGKDRFTGDDGDELSDRMTRAETIIKLNGLDIPFPERHP